MSVELVPASRLSVAELAALFTASFQGYAVPMDVDAATLARMVDLYDLDLDASRVALRGEEPVGLANLGIRGRQAWVGGMGVVPAERRRGLGALLMLAVHEQARARGVREVVLEVIETNGAAAALYRGLGYEPVRELELWTLDAAPPPTGAREVPVREAHARVRERRSEPEPWQRDDATLERLGTSGDLRGLVVAGGAAVLRVTPAGGAVEQLAAGDDTAARDLLAAALAAVRPVRLTNVPADGPAARAAASLGGRLELRQHELRLAL